jgi:hypothetical protein
MNARVVALVVMSSLPAGGIVCAMEPKESEQREATVADAARMRPLRPTGVTVRQSGPSVTVSWTPAPVEKVIGYEVCRRVDEGPFLLLKKVKEPKFIDKDVPAGKVEYAVRAVDLYSNASLLSAPVAKPKAEASPAKD